MTLDAWGYVRLSQRGREGTIEEQKAGIRSYARDRDGLALRTTLNDGPGTSGWNNDREKYQRLKQKIDDGNVEAVVTRDRDRLSRDFDERLRLIALFRETGAEWHIVEDHARIGLEDTMTAGIEAVKAAFSHASKVAEIDRARAATAERIKEGYDHGPPRFGMEYRPDGKYQRPSDEWETVEEIWAMRDDGATFQEIEEQTGVPSSTAERVVSNREWYLKRKEAAHG